MEAALTPKSALQKGIYLLLLQAPSWDAFPFDSTALPQRDIVTSIRSTLCV